MLKAKEIILALSLMTPAVYAAELSSLFEKVRQDNYKGPFGKNQFQCSRGRVPFGAGCNGSMLFQAAWRDENAVALAKEHDFWTANLFTTNYYDLQGDFVYDGSTGHGIDEAALLANNAAAFPRAASIVRHWVIENHFRDKYPEGDYADGWNDRGINTSEVEVHYTKYFFNFYLSSMTIDGGANDQYYLPAFLLAADSPIGEGEELKKSRDLIAATYDYWAGVRGKNDSFVMRMYDIRNAIHNYVSEDVIGMIDRANADFPWYERDGNDRLKKIKAYLLSYYSASAETVAEKAAAQGMVSVVNAANAIVSGGVTPASLLALSEELANYRTNFADMNLIPYAKKAESIVVLARGAKLIAKEINRMDSITDPAAIRALINVIYIEGFLSQDNWEYFANETSTIGAAADAMNEVLATVTDPEFSAVAVSFEPALGQWISVEPTLGQGEKNGFVDAVVKGSSIGAAQTAITKIQR
jgi:hypothetical protein